MVVSDWIRALDRTEEKSFSVLPFSLHPPPSLDLPAHPLLVLLTLTSLVAPLGLLCHLIP